jgi:hypothetical protein
MANAQDRPRRIEALAGAALARYIRYVQRTSWQTPEMTESFEAHFHRHPCIIAMCTGSSYCRCSSRPTSRRRDGGGIAMRRSWAGPKHFDMQ